MQLGRRWNNKKSQVNRLELLHKALERQMFHLQVSADIKSKIQLGTVVDGFKTSCATTGKRAKLSRDIPCRNRNLERMKKEVLRRAKQTGD